MNIKLMKYQVFMMSKYIIFWALREFTILHNNVFIYSMN